MSTNHLMTVDTGLEQDGEPVRAAPRPCGSGSGPAPCDPIQTDYCEFPVSCRLLITFGGALAGIDPFVITYDPVLNGWGWSAGDRFLATPCGVMDMCEFLPQSGTDGYFLSLSFTSGFGASTTQPALYCPLVNGIPPDTEPFTWESGDLELSGVGGEPACPGTFSVTITETTDDGSGSGPGNDYLIAVDTGLEQDGEPVKAAVNCGPGLWVQTECSGDVQVWSRVRVELIVGGVVVSTATLTDTIAEAGNTPTGAWEGGLDVSGTCVATGFGEPVMGLHFDCFSNPLDESGRIWRLGFNGVYVTCVTSAVGDPADNLPLDVSFVFDACSAMSACAGDVVFRVTGRTRVAPSPGAGTIPGPVMYRIAGFMGLRKGGREVLFAEKNPCCEPERVTVACDPPFTLPLILYVTVTGITHAGYPASETHQLVYQPSSGLWALISTSDGNCLFNTGAGALGAAFSITPEDCGMVFTTTNSFNTWGTILQPGSSADPLFAEFSQTGNPDNPFEPATFCAGVGNSLTFTVTEIAP